MAKRIQLNETQLRKMIKEAISKKGKWVHGLYPDNADPVDRIMLRYMVDIERKYGEEMFGQAVRKLYEAGKIEPGAQALSRMADAFEITVDELLGRSTQDQKEIDNETSRFCVDLLSMRVQGVCFCPLSLAL